MTQFFDKAIRAVAKMTTLLGALWEKRSGRFEALQRKKMEAERIDRLRNPSNYQGR
jgi:hypothetical protein